MTLENTADLPNEAETLEEIRKTLQRLVCDETSVITEVIIAYNCLATDDGDLVDHFGYLMHEETNTIAGLGLLDATRHLLRKNVSEEWH